jgi:hypothetical protein
MTDTTQDPGAGHSARPTGAPTPILGDPAVFTQEKEMTTVNNPRADGRAARRGGRPGPPAKLTVWLSCALAALVLAVTIVTIAQSAAAPCVGTAPGRAAQPRAPIQTCVPAGRNPVPGQR